MLDFFKYFYEKFDRFVNEHLIKISLFLFIFIGTFTILWDRVVYIVPAGNVGVIYRPLWGGVDMERVFGEGIHILFPWNKFTQYNARIQNQALELEVLTSDLLKSKVKVIFQYEIDTPTLPILHRYIGPDYLSKVVEPQVISIIRERIGSFSSDKAFTADLQKIVRDITITSDKILVDNVSPPGLKSVKLIRISSVEITNISFPKEVEMAIELKMVEMAKADGYKFILQAARQEAQRKEIEAEGIRKFQDIVRPGLSDNYLRWRGVEATQSLAASNNSKIIIFGQGPTGLPLVLGDMDKTTIPPKSAKPAQ
jgi:regulator of protease activity HflC (stomatin/prohibitin superfamily)